MAVGPVAQVLRRWFFGFFRRSVKSAIAATLACRLGQGLSLEVTQSFQKSLIQEYALNYVGILNMGVCSLIKDFWKLWECGETAIFYRMSS